MELYIGYPNITQTLLAVTVLLLTYILVTWYKNPIRRIPGPPGLPILGNALSLDPTNIHNQFYEMAKEYGPVMKVYIFNQPIVVLNTTEVCLEALVRTGTDFQGRPPFKRMNTVIGKDCAFQTLGAEQMLLRRTFTKALKAYGPGIAHLEKIIQETIRDMIDTIQQREGEVMEAAELTTGYMSCILGAMMFGQKYTFDDEISQMIHRMNVQVLEAGDPLSSGAILDLFPFLFNFKFLFPKTQETVEKAIKVLDDFSQPRINQARATFDPSQKQGCLDHFIEVQQQEVDENGKQLLDDFGIKGLLSNFIIAGMETSLSSISQAFLDLLHDTNLQKRLQAEIDSQFVPTHTITLQDKEKLPQLEAYMYENTRYLSQVPFLVPHQTIRDTQVAGYKIPAYTTVMMNAYCTAHNPDVYDEPFKVKPTRFLDEEGNLVDRDHPFRQNLLSFGAGRRQCPGELLAKSRIFLFLANILQKFDIEAVGELPDRDVRKYKMAILLTPPPVKVRFIRRQQ